MKERERPQPSDANRYIAPDPKPHIDHEKVRQQRQLSAKALKLMERGDLDGVLKLMEGPGFTSDQRERVKALFHELHGSPQNAPGGSGGSRRR
jgi:hypothetical protein